ncbi:MAG: UDP-N-acetylmuramoyl-L-alanine--D-glutamate ligase, partial [Polyangiales bacterium]
MELAGTRVTVVGLGQSGLAVVRLLKSKGASITVNDARQEAQLGALAIEAKQLGATLSLGDHEPARFADAQLIVVSPGVPPLPALADAARRGIAVVSEIELASWFITAPIVGITGTNGKSTVTSLCGAIAQATGRPSFCGGNLGTPL